MRTTPYSTLLLMARDANMCPIVMFCARNVGTQDASNGLGAETPSCSICSSGSGLNELEICANCQEFLSDSVAEDSHSKMICLKASPGDCHITAENTKSFSACPGCWISKLRSSGVIEKYLVQIGYTVKQEEEFENQETSIIN